MTTQLASPTRPARRRPAKRSRGRRPATPRPTRPDDQAGKIEVCRAECGTQYHRSGCALLQAEVTLPSRHDLQIALDDLVAQDRYDYRPRPAGVLRRTLREWRSPESLDPGRICPCLRPTIAAHLH